MSELIKIPRIRFKSALIGGFEVRDAVLVSSKEELVKLHGPFGSTIAVRYTDYTPVLISNNVTIPHVKKLVIFLYRMPPPSSLIAAYGTAYIISTVYFVRSMFLDIIVESDLPLPMDTVTYLIMSPATASKVVGELYGDKLDGRVLEVWKGSAEAIVRDPDPPWRRDVEGYGVREEEGRDEVRPVGANLLYWLRKGRSNSGKGGNRAV